jgi:hypothetical protein
MATITVEGIPEGLLARLKIAADGNGRSLNSEVIIQLVQSLACSREAGAAGGSRLSFPRAPGSGCHCSARRVEARAVGWGGPAR